MKPQKRCNHVGCRMLIDYDKRFCEQHKALHNKTTYKDRKVKDEKYLQFYNSKQWRKASYLYKLKNPLCEECLKENIIKKADVTDHVDEIKDNFERRLDVTNFKSLCHAHHNQKTLKVKKERLNK